MRKFPEHAEPEFLFLKEEFLRNQGSYLLLSESGVEIAFFGEKCWRSPAKAPFGGFSFQAFPDESILRRLFAKINAEAKNHGIESIEIQLAPCCYFGESGNPVKQLLLEDGYSELWTDLNFHLVPDRPFRKYLHRSERWKLNKSERTGFHFQPVADPDWDSIHLFIRQSRERKGYQISLSASELKEMTSHFPGRYNVWQVLSPQLEAAAIAVTVMVSESIEYIFYTADDVRFRKWSPVVMLHAGIYEDALLRGIQLLDLGTASLHGEINTGVAAFKSFLGGMVSPKIRLHKKLASQVS